MICQVTGHKLKQSSNLTDEEESERKDYDAKTIQLPVLSNLTFTSQMRLFQVILGAHVTLACYDNDSSCVGGRAVEARLNAPVEPRYRERCFGHDTSFAQITELFHQPQEEPPKLRFHPINETNMIKRSLERTDFLFKASGKNDIELE